MSVKILVKELKKTPFFVDATIRNTQNAIGFMRMTSSFYAQAEQVASEADTDEEREVTDEEMQDGVEEVNQFENMLNETIKFVDGTLKLTEAQHDKLLDFEVDELMGLSMKIASSIMSNGNEAEDKAGLKS